MSEMEIQEQLDRIDEVCDDLKCQGIDVSNCKFVAVDETRFTVTFAEWFRQEWNDAVSVLKRAVSTGKG